MKHHRLSEIFFLTVLEAGSPDESSSRVRVLVTAFFLVCKCLLCPHVAFPLREREGVGGGRSGRALLFIKSPVLMPSFNLNYLPKNLFPNIATLGDGGFNIHIWGTRFSP